MADKVKRQLKVVLKADDFVVAESEDERLWRAVLDEVYRSEESGGGAGLGLSGAETRPPAESASSQQVDVPPPPSSGNRPIAGVGAFADELGVSIDAVTGGCRPTSEPPFIRLDHHHWEAMKRQTPSRGRGAISPVVLAATLLVLWQRHGQTPATSLAAVQATLSTVNIRDKNPGRGIKNCPWLQLDGSKITLHPANVSSAIELCKSYCTKKWNSKSEK